MAHPNAPADRAGDGALEAASPPTQKDILTDFDRVRRAEQLLAEFGASISATPIKNATQPTIAAVAGPSLAVAASRSPIRLTKFANDDGLLTKRISLDANGDLQSKASAYFSRGSYRTLTIQQIDDLKPIIAELQPHEALAWGEAAVAPAGRIATAKAIKDGRAQSGAIARSNTTFAWPDGPGVLMLDVDQKDAPDALRANSTAEVRSRLISICPSLAEAPMLVIPSAGACIYKNATGECLSGLTGVRGYVLVERAVDIPEIGRRLRDRLALAGHSFEFISKAGTIHVRTTIDDSVWRPSRLDFVGGPECDDGLSQRRGVPETWNSSAAPLRLDQVPPLSDDARAKMREIEASIKTAAIARALEVRALWEAAQRAAGRKVSVSWRPDGSVEFLKGDHEIRLTDGTWVSIVAIRADPARYHDQTCADPLEPDYRGDMRIAKIYSAQPTPIIHSNAHGGINYVLMTSPQAEFTDAAADLPAFTTEHEELASLLGDPDRLIGIVLPTLAESADVSVAIDQLVYAAGVPHPRRALFDDKVLLQAKSLLSFLNNEPAFARLLRSQLKDTQWTALSSAAQTLLIRGAYVMLAPYDRLVGDAMRRPKLIADTRGARTYLVESAIPDGSMLGIIGPAGSGKSTTARALAWCVGQPPSVELLTERAAPPTFAGLPVSHGTALYFCSEDIPGVEAARRKMAAAYGPSPHAHFIDGVPPLSSISATINYVRDALALVRTPESPPVRLVVIDLFRDAFQGNENDSADVGAAMAAAYAINRLFRCTVAVVHHTALADDARARGSGAFLGKLDVCAAVALRDGTITWKLTKARHEASGRALRWHLDAASVLRSGAGVGVTGNVAEECARVIARVVHEIASVEAPMSRRELNAILVAEHPRLFGPAENKATVQSRVTRGISRGDKAGWIVERKKMLVPGAVRPPEDESNNLSASPADLVGVL